MSDAKTYVPITRLIEDSRHAGFTAFGTEGVLETLKARAEIHAPACLLIARSEVVKFSDAVMMVSRGISRLPI